MVSYVVNETAIAIRCLIRCWLSYKSRVNHYFEASKEFNLTVGLSILTRVSLSIILHVKLQLCEQTGGSYERNTEPIFCRTRTSRLNNAVVMASKNLYRKWDLKLLP
jgi:hypothetical protein